MMTPTRYRRRYVAALCAGSLAFSLASCADNEDKKNLDPQTRLCTADEIAYIEGGGSSSQTNGSVTGGNATGGEEAWLTPGTPEFEVAQQIYDFFTKEKGTSGAFAAGVLANVKQESGFVPNVSEGGGRFPLPNGTTPDSGGPGGGLYQFTPYSKYTGSTQFAEGGWEPNAQSEFVWASEIMTNAVSAALKNAPNQYGMEAPFTSAYTAVPKSDGTTAAVTLDPNALLTADDPIRAAKGFQVGYERPQVYHPEREPDAIKANNTFNKDNFKGDPEKLKESLPLAGVITGANALDTIGQALSGNLKPRQLQGPESTLFQTPCIMPDGTYIRDINDANEKAMGACGAVNGSGRSPNAAGGTSSGAGEASGNAFDRLENKDKLKPDALNLAKDVAEKFPEVDTIGGWRAKDPFPDHPSGRAIDVMVPVGSELGDRVNEYIWQNAEKYHIEYTIWKQMYYPSADAPSMMEDRGSPTQNHFDHVHVTVAEEGQDGAKSGSTAGSSSKRGSGSLCGPGSGGKGGSIKPNANGVAIPAEGVLTSNYGMRDIGRGPEFHNGIDIAAPVGTPIYAAAGGTVVNAGPADGFGLWIVIDHGDGTYGVYGHQIANHVKIGDTVSAGDHIADMGSGGESTGSHLHFTVTDNPGNTGNGIDPNEWFAANGITLPPTNGQVTKDLVE